MVQVIGWENIELISDRPLETMLDEFKRLKAEYPDRHAAVHLVHLLSRLECMPHEEDKKDLCCACLTECIDACALRLHNTLHVKAHSRSWDDSCHCMLDLQHASTCSIHITACLMSQQGPSCTKPARTTGRSCTQQVTQYLSAPLQMLMPLCSS